MHKYEPALATGADGRLYDTRLRSHMQGEEGDVVAREALAAMRFASHAFRVSMDRWLEKHGLSEGRMGVLWMLARSGPTSLGELAIALDVSARNITGLIDHLERDGLVQRSPDPEDRRSVRANLSILGKAKLAGIQKELANARQTVVAGFSDDELKDLRHLCLKLVQNTNARQTKEMERV